MGMMLGAAAIGGVASIGGALIQSNAAQQASDAQVAAAKQAQQTQVDATNAALQTSAPFTQIGTGAANQIANLYGIPYSAINNGQSSTSASGIVAPGNINAAASSAGGSLSSPGVSSQILQNSPDYKFAFDQGMQALQRSAAAGGTLISGGQLKAGQEFGQGLATQTLNNYVGHLQTLANMGQSAAAGQANTGLSGANSVANSQQAAGQAAASGIVGSANALSGGLNGVSSSVMNSLLLSKLGGTNTSAYGATPASGYTGTATGLNNSLFNWAGLGTN